MRSGLAATRPLSYGWPAGSCGVRAYSALDILSEITSLIRTLAPPSVQVFTSSLIFSDGEPSYRPGSTVAARRMIVLARRMIVVLLSGLRSWRLRLLAVVVVSIPRPARRDELGVILAGQSRQLLDEATVAHGSSSPWSPQDGISVILIPCLMIQNNSPGV